MVLNKHPKAGAPSPTLAAAIRLQGAVGSGPSVPFTLHEVKSMA